MSRIALGLLLLAATSLAHAQPPQAIVVLGTTVLPDGQPGPKLQRRLRTALAAHRGDPQATLLLTGGITTGPRAEAEVMADWLARHGVLRQDMVLEPQARNTAENADYSIPLLRALGIHKATLVSDRTHLARAGLHFRGAARAAHADVSFDGLAAPDGLSRSAHLRAQLIEWLKLPRDAYYRWRAHR
jgi:uncharacterized SAM-binding protein YcdF (DUF218 family)